MLKFEPKWIKVILINMGSVLLSLELFSLGFYGLKMQQLFYTRSPASKQTYGAVHETENTGVDLDESLLLRLHPYFGYTDFKPEEPTINNYQFGSLRDYPVVKENDRQYIIGIFGGSVALAIANTEAQYQIITNTLQQLPQFADKEIIVLNFAQGGYKQPQQLLVFNYFLSLRQRFDMVINIDGFNEVALSSLNYPENVHLSLPNGSLMKALVNLGNHQFSAKDLEIAIKTREYNATLRKIQNRQQSCWFALYYISQQFHYQLLRRDYQQFLSKQEQKTSETVVLAPTSNAFSLFYLNPPDPDTTAETLYPKIAQTWLNSSILMHQTLASQNGLYFHFLQPNQYYPTQRQFTPQEQQQAINPEQIYAQGVQQGYPVLMAALTQLQNNQVNFFNAATVFDAESQPVYSDDCCHYNLLGNQIFSQFIANRIAQTLQAEESAPTAQTKSKNLAINNP
ncbi:MULTISPECIES: hypothetical protein [unclassified Roseofilum]|uniref:hypothetical protein n=1 Tax=unclassified Roseofilum TaxID=2620099 RepID=UPI000E9AB62C|nr:MULTISPECIES: hypothetical protein [unclassified Roseofilum]MBP0007852.1 hypothetical protein [Roseofilum sp. Belize Diploria]MBP0033220.1 hypothetical protein [Roseofilum sp. Belize BBD 4]HBQ98834.1 hypothetical protein [Cyanobacteria bacterium UBA11691]